GRPDLGVDLRAWRGARAARRRRSGASVGASVVGRSRPAASPPAAALTMASTEEIREAARIIEARVAELRDEIAADPELRRRGGMVFPHLSIYANLGPIFELLGKSGNEALLCADAVTHIADIGVGNGEIAFMLARCGYKVTAIDYA